MVRGGTLQVTEPELPLCSIVIPVYNQWIYTDKCLRSIARCASSAVTFEVVVVNNASTDGTEVFLDEAKKRFGFLRAVPLDCNYGFGRACNEGAKIARGELLVFLNNDTVVLPGWLEALVDAYRSTPCAGIVGAKLLYPDQTVQHAGMSFIWTEVSGRRVLWPTHLWRGYPSTAPEVNREGEVDAVTGACLVIGRNLFEAVGGFDESYYMYFEDVDLNLKVRSRGRKVIYCPKSVVIHFESKSSPGPDALRGIQDRSFQIFYRKWEQQLLDWTSKREMGALTTFPCSTEEKSKCAPPPIRIIRGIKWQSQILNFSGHASHARRIVTALKQTKIPLAVQSTAHDKLFVRQLPASEVAEWRKLMDEPVGQGAYLCFAVPTLQDGTDVFAHWRKANPGFSCYVGLATFETDSLPQGWAEACNGMNEIWVPSTFNKETFARGGVDLGSIDVFPTGIDPLLYDPRRVAPLSIKNRRGFAFLSVFQWTYRKGWDVLLRAFLSAFSPHEDVCLILRAYPYGMRQPPLKERIRRYVESLDFDLKKSPPIILLDTFIPERFMPSLYAAADAFVLPSRGEGFGLPLMQAMSMELPVIATRWGGHLDYMNDENSLLIDLEALLPVDERLSSESVYYTADQRLAEPSVSHTAELMRWVFEHRTEAQRIGRAARHHVVTQWSLTRSADWFKSKLSWIMS